MNPLLVLFIIALIAYAIFAAYRTHKTIQRRKREDEDRDWPGRRRLPYAASSSPLPRKKAILVPSLRVAGKVRWGFAMQKPS